GGLIFRPACLFLGLEKAFRDGPERTQLNGLLNMLSNVALTASPDGWIFNSTDSTSFSISEMRYIIDSSFLYSSGVRVRWNKNLPIKINIHSWRLSLNRLPTRFNLDRSGIDLNSVRCPVCDDDIETDLHVFVKCPIVDPIWNSISRWWNISDFPKDINGLIKWSDTLTLNKHTKICLDVVIQTSLWIIWRYRNRMCFDLKPTRKDTLMEQIMIFSHSWILYRNRSYILVGWNGS
nr:RNA-directed DNA polymerase, eukaryota [Tanacetum cinerariifolium]